VKVTLQSFQRRVIATGLTDKQGTVKFTGIESPSSSSPSVQGSSGG